MREKTTPEDQIVDKFNWNKHGGRAMLVCSVGALAWALIASIGGLVRGCDADEHKAALAKDAETNKGMLDRAAEATKLAVAQAEKAKADLKLTELQHSPASCLEKIMQIGCNDKVELRCDHADHELIVNHAVVECRCTRHKHAE